MSGRGITNPMEATVSRSFLAAIRNAVTSAEQEPAPRSAPAGDVAGAHGEGHAAAAARFGAILKAEGIAGNAARMDAAVDLAARSPDMSADDVVAFVIANVAAAPAVPAAALANRYSVDPVTSERSRTSGNADPLGAMLGGGLPPAAADGWQEAIAQATGKVIRN